MTETPETPVKTPTKTPTETPTEPFNPPKPEQVPEPKNQDFTKQMKVDSIYWDHNGNFWRVVRRWPERIHNYETLEEDFAGQLCNSKHWELFDNAGQAKFSDTKLILLQASQK